MVLLKNVGKGCSNIGLLQLEEHNMKAYTEVKELLKRDGRAAVVQATGTGKSKVIIRTIQDYRNVDKILLAPSADIIEQFIESEGWSDNRIKTITYARLNRIFDYKGITEDDIREYLGNLKLIVADELHRTGAEHWGESFRKLIDMYPDADILGATATPVRLLDNNRDMVEELFGGNYAGRLNLLQAIEMGILPKPVYISSLYSVKSEISKREKRARGLKYGYKQEFKNRLDNIRLEWESNLSVDKIINKHMRDMIKDNKGIKVIVFCTDVRSLDIFKDEVMQWFKLAFPNIPIEIFKYHIKEYGHREQYLKFKESPVEGSIKILMAIDKLNEGVHMDDVGAIIMLRKTTSNIVYYQQLGRVLSIGGSDKPVIIDLVNNCNEVGFSLAFWKKVKSRESVRDKNKKEYKKRNIEIYDYTKDVSDLLEKIDKRIDNVPHIMLEKVLKAVENGEDINNLTDENLQRFVRYYLYNRGSELAGKEFRAIAMKLEQIGAVASGSERWEDYEDAIILKYYTEEGRWVQKRLSNRTIPAIHARAIALGITINREWAEEEDEILLKYYPYEGKRVGNRLKGRTELAIAARAGRLGIRVEDLSRKRIEKEWSDYDDNILKRHYAKDKFNISDKLKEYRTQQEILNRAIELGIHKIKNKWTYEEDNIIMEYYPTEGSLVGRRLKNRTKSAVQNRARVLGVKIGNVSNWTGKEDEILRKYYGEEGIDVVKRLGGRTRESVVGRVRKLGLYTNKYMSSITKEWSEDEDEILRSFYPLEGIKVAKRIDGRDRKQVKARIRKLGLIRMVSWSKQEDNLLIKYYPVEGSGVIDRFNGRTIHSIKSRAKKLGLKYTGIKPK